MSLSRRGRPFTQEHKDRIANALRGRPLSEDRKLKISLASMGKILSKEHRAKVGRKGRKAWNRGVPMLHLRGEKHPNWKGGRTPIAQKERSCIELREWRRQVFGRDNFTCQFCGQRGGRLEADHIKPWAIFKNLRFDVSNGRTLCKACHATTPTYKGKGNRKQHTSSILT